MSDSGKHKRALVVGWDGATWRGISPLIDGGQMPNLQHLVEAGVSATLSATEPPFAPLLFNSLCSGKFADKHGVLGQWKAIRASRIPAPKLPKSRVRSCWDLVNQAGRRCLVVGVPNVANTGLSDGIFLPHLSFFAPPDHTGTKQWARGILQHAGLSAELAELFISLEDIDGQTMAYFIPRYAELAPNHPVLLHLAQALARTLSQHAIATHLATEQEWDLQWIDYPLLTDLTSLPELLGDADPALLHNVEAAAYAFLDMLLGRLIELAAEDVATLAYSTRGIDLAGLSTGDVLDVKGQGIFAMSASGLPADQLVHQVGHVDICPTLLHHFALPIARDFDGIPLQERLFPEQPAARIDTWESLNALPAVSAADFPLAQTLALDKGCSADNRHKARQVNALVCLAEVLLATGRGDQALPLLWRLFQFNPLIVDQGLRLAEALYRYGETESQLTIVKPLAATFADSPVGQFMQGYLALLKGDREQALQFFELARSTSPAFPLLYHYLGQMYLMMHQVSQAIDAFARSLSLDSAYLPSHVAFSEALLRAGRFDEAMEAALDAVACEFAQPVGHLCLARALLQLDELDAARQALENALRFAPDDPSITQHVARLDALQNNSDVSREGLTPPMSIALNPVKAGQECLNDVQREVEQARIRFTCDLADAARQEASSPTVAPSLLMGVRAAEPGDLPFIADMFADPFTDPMTRQVLILEQGESVLGGISLEAPSRRPTDIRLSLSVRREPGENAEASPNTAVALALVQAAVARARAGGAERLMLRNDIEAEVAEFRSGLSDLGFREPKEWTRFHMPSELLQNRCLELVARLQKRGRIPEGIEVLSLEHFELERVNAFMAKFGFGPSSAEADPYHDHLSLMLVQDGEIIAGGIGWRKDEQTVHAKRVAVDDAHRGSWVTPMILGHLAKASFDHGLSTIAFETDVSERKDWAKIARGLNSLELGVYYESLMVMGEA